MTEVNETRLRKILTESQNAGIGSDYRLSIAAGNAPGVSRVRKFGRYVGLPPTERVIRSFGGNELNYPSASSELLVSSSSPGDAVTGSSARTIIIEGLDANFNNLRESINLSGTSANKTTGSFMRVNRAYVEVCGNYASIGTGSNTGTIDIVHSASNVKLSEIGRGSTTGWGLGQTTQTNYTVPNGYTAYLEGFNITSDVITSTELTLWTRSRADVVTGSNMAGKRALVHTNLILGIVRRRFSAPEAIAGKTDIYWTGRAAASTPIVNVEYDLILVQD